MVRVQQHLDARTVRTMGLREPRLPGAWGGVELSRREGLRQRDSGDARRPGERLCRRLLAGERSPDADGRTAHGSSPLPGQAFVQSRDRFAVRPENERVSRYARPVVAETRLRA